MLRTKLLRTDVQTDGQTDGQSGNYMLPLSREPNKYYNHNSWLKLTAHTNK